MMSYVTLSEANASRLRDAKAGLQGAETLQDIASTYEGSRKNQRDKLLVAFAQLSDISESAWGQTEVCKKIGELVARDLDGTGYKENNALTVEAALACLYVLASRSKDGLPTSLVAYLVAFTDSHDSWTTVGSQAITSGILNSSVASDGFREFVVEDVLKNWIRPVFSKSTTKLTSSGRPAQFPGTDDKTYPRGLEPPAWKAQGPRVVSAFRWAVEASDEALLRENWPLFTPILLTIAEADDTPTRTTGLEIMSTFLDKCPAKVLKSTGIGKVFQDAIFPSVLFLPSLTPEAESIQIMQPAYRALIILAEKDPDTSSPTRRLLLDSIIREGILTAYDHASSYIHVVETLLRTLATVVNCLGVYTVKHLQTLLPTISTVMTDPFVVSHPPALLEATKALQAILANCWPRICQGGYADEVTRIIATCWLNIQDDEVDSLVLPGLLGELKKLASMLRSIQHAQGDKTVPRVEEILKAEPKLRELFSTTEAGAT